MIVQKELANNPFGHGISLHVVLTYNIPYQLYMYIFCIDRLCLERTVQELRDIFLLEALFPGTRLVACVVLWCYKMHGNNFNVTY